MFQSLPTRVYRLFLGVRITASGSRVLVEHPHHSIITIARLMNVLDGYRQSYRLIDEPCRIEHPIGLVDDDGIILLQISSVLCARSPFCASQPHHLP